jgi:hypothetical protein
VEWWGPAHRLERFETDDDLMFQTVNLQRKGEVALAIVFGVASLVILGFNHFVWCLILGLAAAMAAYGWFSTRVRCLVITRQILKGDPDTAAWSEVYELRDESGGEDGPSGLFARTGLMRSKCVLQDATRAECDEIEVAIYTKWPNLQMAPRPEGIWSAIKKSFGGRTSG